MALVVEKWAKYAIITGHLMLLVRSLYSSLLNFLIFGALLFWPARTWHWERAWIFLGVVLVCTLATMVFAFRDNEELLKERMKPPFQKGQPWTDKIILGLFLVSFIKLIILIPEDVFHRHLLPAPPIGVAALGLGLFIAGWVMIAFTFRANAFAAPVVKLQAERDHKVIDTGVYAFVRHPMYAGAVLLMVGMPLWLGSTAAAVFALVPTVLLAVRIIFEEKFLRAALPGYAAYTRRVRSRLIPFIW